MITLFTSTKNKRIRDRGRTALKISSGRPGYPYYREKIYHLTPMEVRMMFSQLKRWDRKGVL